MFNRVQLKPQQKVILIYDIVQGFISEPAYFVESQEIEINGVFDNIPIFQCGKRKVTGLECFWILPENVTGPNHISQMHFQLIRLQMDAIIAAKLLNIEPYIKIKDRDIEYMAQEKFEQINSIVKKLGYDPRDESWIETDLASNIRERNWFLFERRNPLLFSKPWKDLVGLFNHQYQDNLSTQEAKNLSKKRMRYLLGSFYTRRSGNGNKEDWKTAAQKFEKTFRDSENRMLSWSLSHKDNFPLVRTRTPVRFTPGPYFHECIERIPSFFTDTKIVKLKPGLVLRVIAYDPELKYIRLDFLPETRKLVTGQETDTPWLKDEGDYDIWIQPNEIPEQLEIINPII